MINIFEKNFSFTTIPAIVFFLFFATDIPPQTTDKTTKQIAFQQVFGDAVRLDAAMIEKVKAGKPGQRHYVDKNKDGKPEEVWFIDIHPRHSQRYRPLLVRVIDEDNDLEFGKEPDKDSDLWIADWNADGLTDAAIDYNDSDKDNDVDDMGMFFFDNKVGLRVWWFIDDGDDNLLAYDIDYIYYQRPCQDFTHFGGNESLISMYYDPSRNMWIPFWENPFLFFDDDDDAITEEVVRVEGQEHIMRYLRWSFNVNPVAGKPRNYDVGITACAQGWTEKKDRESNFSFHLSKEQTQFFKLRGIPTGPVVKRFSARDFLRKMQWARVLMTWDENDLNTAWDRPGDEIERWEGIISAASKEPGFYMPQVGGPDCGPFNKRYELVLEPKGMNTFYFNPADHRIHIKNSDKTWINVDFDGDLKTDMYYSWADNNKDGIMDEIKIDTDGDGKTDDSIALDISGIKTLSWQFEDFNKIHVPVLATEPENKFHLIHLLSSALESIHKNSGRDAVWNFIEEKMLNGNFSSDIARRLVDSDESIMYYFMLVQDRQIEKLKKSNAGSKIFWQAFNKARSKGDTKAMTAALKKYFKQNIPVKDYQAWITALREKETKPRVAWDNKWLPPNWGWESEKAAYRFYDGHFDMFGKRMDTLIYPKIKEGKSYHLDQNGWGMDILHVGKTSGLGGITLYVNGAAYPVRNEKEINDPVFSHRLLEENPVKITLEFTALNVGPKNNPYAIKIRPCAMAGRVESPVEIIVEGGKPSDKIELGIGITRLPEEDFFYNKKAGTMGSWGFQEAEIGWVGMGIIYPAEKFIRMEETPLEHRVVLQCKKGVPITYFIQADWRRGHQFPCCPTAKNWEKRLLAASEEIKHTQHALPSK